MSNEPIRGHSLSSASLMTDAGVELEARQVVSYQCSKCDSVLSIPFALEADVPDHWTCSRCGNDAWRDGADRTSVAPEKVGKTPFEMLLERRSREELEEILQERLSYLRSRRGLVDESFAS
jgi:hypothetical protein